MSTSPWEPPAEEARVEIDHAVLATLDAWSDAATWDAALGAMGVPATLLGSAWPDAVRVFARERLTPAGVDRWALARVGVVGAAGVAMVALAALVLVVWLPWAQQPSSNIVDRGPFAGMSRQGVGVFLVLLVGLVGIPSTAGSVLKSLGPRDAASEKARRLASAARALRAHDFVARFELITVRNDPSGAWLAQVEGNAAYMKEHADKAGGEASLRDQLRGELDALLEVVAQARRRRAAAFVDALARLARQDGNVAVPLDFDVEALARVDRLASRIERFRRWLPAFPEAPPAASTRSNGEVARLTPPAG